MSNMLRTEDTAQYAPPCEFSFHDFKGICTSKTFLCFFMAYKIDQNNVAWWRHKNSNKNKSGMTTLGTRITHEVEPCKYHQKTRFRSSEASVYNILKQMHINYPAATDCFSRFPEILPLTGATYYFCISEKKKIRKKYT